VSYLIPSYLIPSLAGNANAEWYSSEGQIGTITISKSGLARIWISGTNSSNPCVSKKGYTIDTNTSVGKKMYATVLMQKALAAKTRFQITERCKTHPGYGSTTYAEIHMIYAN
jgi:flagellar hook assembly protein FlgD